MQRSIYEVVVKIIDEIPIDNVDMIYDLKKLTDDMAETVLLKWLYRYGTDCQIF